VVSLWRKCDLTVQFFAIIQLSFIICNAIKYEEELMFISPFFGVLNMANNNWRSLHNIGLNHFRSMGIFLNVEYFLQTMCQVWEM
jgi:hypothetical protein